MMTWRALSVRPYLCVRQNEFLMCRRKEPNAVCCAHRVALLSDAVMCDFRWQIQHVPRFEHAASLRVEVLQHLDINVWNESLRVVAAQVGI